MKKPLKIVIGTIVALVLTSPFTPSKADTSGCRTCDEVTAGSSWEVRIEYQDGTARSACGLRCAGAMLAAYRGKDVKTIWVREHGSGKLLDAKKTFWVVGLKDGRKEPFSERSEAESFSMAQGGRIANFKDVMAAVFSEMYGDIRKDALVTGEGERGDIAAHPKCAYCGMDRKQYAYSRVLIRYRNGSEIGLCSIHCAGLDLVLHPEKIPARIMVGTYDRGDLVDAEKAVWVLGGAKHGTMSIRGKWAFERKADAEAFMRDFGGSTTDFRNIMTAAFEDMWEILR